ELGVCERQLLHVADACVDASCPRKVNHPLRAVEHHDLGAELARDALRKLAGPATNLEHTPRHTFCDRLEGDLACVRSLDVRVDRPARRSRVLARALSPDA